MKWLSHTSMMIAGALVVAGAALPVPKVGSCASGYVQSGGYCTPMAGQQKQAVPKLDGKQCPGNMRQSGAYCVEK